MSDWRKEEVPRCERNETCWKTHRDELQFWRDKKNQALLKKHRTRWTKPTREKLEGPILKPVVASAEVDEVEENVDEDAENEDAQSDDD